MGRRENRETYLYLYLSVENAHLALELQAGLGDVHGERGTLREHGRGAREAELRREAFKAATGITTTHASRHGAVGVGCDAKIFDLEAENSFITVPCLPDTQAAPSKALPLLSCAERPPARPGAVAPDLFVSIYRFNWHLTGMLTQNKRTHFVGDARVVFKIFLPKTSLGVYTLFTAPENA